MSRSNLKRPNSVILPAKTDSFMPNTRPITNSRSMTHIDSLKDGFNINNVKTIKKWTYLDNSNKSSCLPDRTININMNESSSEKAHFQEHITKSPSKVQENIKPFVSKCPKQNSAESLTNKPEENAKAEVKFETSIHRTPEQFQIMSQAKTSATDGINMQNNIVENDAKGKIVNDKDDNSKNQSLNSFENAHSILETDDETKIEEREENKKEACEDESFFDDIWESYVERPLLPLKPLQKQRSLSCTNLVQTIKGLSKRKNGANNRFSSPENILFESKELCTSEANITNVPPKKISVDSADQNFRRFNNINDTFTTKKEYQSLQHYSWYHLISAKEASKRLLHMHQSGSFLIRPASNPTTEILHTLCVVFFGRVYNFHVKNLKDGQITLGLKNAEKKVFSSLLDMIKYHQTVPITINIAGQVVCVHLLITPPK